MAFCNNCGSYLPDDAVTCPICNAPVRAAEEAPAAINDVVASAPVVDDAEEYGTTVLSSDDYDAPATPVEAQPAEEESAYSQYFNPEPVNQPEPEAAPQADYVQPQQEQYYQQPQQQQYYQQPAYQQPAYQQPAYQQPAAYTPAYVTPLSAALQAANKAKNMGLASLLISLIGSWIIPFVAPILSLVLGCVGISKAGAASTLALQSNDMPAANQAKSAKTMSIVGLVFSIINILLTIAGIILLAVLAEEGYYY